MIIEILIFKRSFSLLRETHRWSRSIRVVVIEIDQLLRSIPKIASRILSQIFVVSDPLNPILELPIVHSRS